MTSSQDFEHSDLPSVDGLDGGNSRTSLIGSIFGGNEVERRPFALVLAVAIIILIGFIVGSLVTLGILNGVIEIDPKAIKSVLKSILGKS